MIWLQVRASTENSLLTQQQPMEKGVKTPQSQPVGQNSTVRCFGCVALGHYRDKCPARGKGGPAEAPGKDQRGKSSKGQVANLRRNPSRKMMV